MTAATLGKAHANASLTDVQEIASALTPFVGTVAGKILFAIGVSGAAIISAIMISLATSWAFGEIKGFARSLNHKWQEAPAFYGLYIGGIVLAAIVVLSRIPLVT